MRELGVTQIFARSPQAKGRVERAAGTFQDRLVTELSDASASTIAEAQAVLERFLPRFNARFAVAASQREPAWRPLDPALDLGAILAFRHTRTVARDNTVKYHWRTLQLLPSAQRPSYAGARVDVLERPGGELAVRHQGETIPSRLAPPRSGVLRERRSELARDPALERLALGLGSGVAPPDQPELPAAANGTAANGASPQARVKPLRPPTPRQQTLWKGHPPGTTAGALDARHRPRAGHLPQHRPLLPPRRRPHPGARVRHHLRATTSARGHFR